MDHDRQEQHSTILFLVPRNVVCRWGVMNIGFAANATVNRRHTAHGSHNNSSNHVHNVMHSTQYRGNTNGNGPNNGYCWKPLGDSWMHGCAADHCDTNARRRGAMTRRTRRARRCESLTQSHHAVRNGSSSGRLGRWFHHGTCTR